MQPASVLDARVTALLLNKLRSPHPTIVTTTGAEVAAFDRVRDASRVPQYGCDCYAYGVLAAGLADVVVEADLKPYDYLALVPIVQGAGGVITDWTGGELVLEEGGVGKAYQVAAAGDTRTHQEVLALLDWREQ